MFCTRMQWRTLNVMFYKRFGKGFESIPQNVLSPLVLNRFWPECFGTNVSPCIATFPEVPFWHSERSNVYWHRGIRRGLFNIRRRFSESKCPSLVHRGSLVLGSACLRSHIKWFTMLSRMILSSKRKKKKTKKAKVISKVKRKEVSSQLLPMKMLTTTWLEQFKMAIS